MSSVSRVLSKVLALGGLLGSVLFCALGCAPSGISLAVDLRTEMRPGVEFVTVETQLYAGVGIAALDLPQSVSPPHVPEPQASLFTGVRVAEFMGLDDGDYLVRVQLLDEAGAIVGTGLASVRLVRSAHMITVIVNRTCRGVDCPGDGSPNEIACLGGRCVDPACVNEPSACPPPICLVDSGCPAEGPSCVDGACLVGFCVRVTDDASCGGSRCDLDRGCVGAPEDAGARDAGLGRDAGPFDGGSLDAGSSDAGADGGTDAGPPDGGTDAGPPDAGIPCIQVPNSTQNISFSMLDSADPTWTVPSTLSCPASPGTTTPYYNERIYCNEMAAPYGFMLEIMTHPSFPTVGSPTIWGYSGAGVPADPTDCDWVASGVGDMTPYELLLPGEYFTIRYGGRATGETGSLAARSTP